MELGNSINGRFVSGDPAKNQETRNEKRLDEGEPSPVFQGYGEDNGLIQDGRPECWPNLRPKLVNRGSMRVRR
jgi:hypothetical protein